MNHDKIHDDNYCSEEESDDMTVEEFSEVAKSSHEQKRGMVCLPSMRIPEISSKRQDAFSYIEENVNSSSEESDHHEDFKTLNSSQERLK